jgi:hypothetical protein
MTRHALTLRVGRLGTRNFDCLPFFQGLTMGGTSGTRPPGNEIAPRTCCGRSDNSSGLTSRLLHIIWSINRQRHTGIMMLPRARTSLALKGLYENSFYV